MFGGLDIKGTASSKDSAEEAPAPAASAFGFMNATTEASEPASETPAASSGFSFLNTASEPAPAPTATSGFWSLQESPAPAAPKPATAPEPAPVSGFSFMMPSSTDQVASTPVSEAPAGTSTSGEDAAPASETAPSAIASGFSFITAVEPTAEPALEPAPEPAPESAPESVPEPAPEPAPEPVPAPVVSSFDFLATTPDPEPVTTTTSVSTTSSVNAPSSTPAPPNVLDMAPAIPSMPAGAGVSFGAAAKPPGVAGAGISFGSAIKPAGVRKKKTRGKRVGVGAGVAASPVPAPVAPVVKPPVVKEPLVKEPVPAPAAVERATSRDAADEAARRAEEFMNQKAMQEATQPPPEPLSAPEIPSYDDVPALQPTASTDEVVAAAQAAAEEAIALSKQHQPKSGFMGTFFKGFKAGSSSSLGSAGSGSKQRRPSPSPDSVGDSVDRLAKEQEKMKRAIAERQIKMQQEQNDDDDDDVVIVSTSASGYTKPEPATTSAPVPSSFAPPKEKPEVVVRELPPRAPSPKKKKTPTEVFEEYQALFAQSVHRAIEAVETVRTQQKMLSEERFVALAKERLMEQQITQTEAQLQVAVDEEDYELADQLGEVVDAHKREKNEVALMLEANAKAMKALDGNKTLVVQGAATCFDNLAMRLTELKETESANEEANDVETLKQFATISKQLSTEHERLQQDLKHLERDEKLVAEERKELEDAISEQTGEYEQQQEKVSEELTTLEEEIDALRKELEAKQTEAAALRIEMHGFEDSISRVRVKFSRQLTRVDKKELSLQENRNEWENEQVAHKLQKEAHELQVQSHSEALLAHDALMEKLESELKLSKEFAELAHTKLGFTSDEKSDDSFEDEVEGDLAQLQADVVKCEAAVSEAKILLKAATAAISNLQSEHETLVASIPQLETQKKAAAAKRDFKAAGKASKEIKDATARLKECEGELTGEAATRKTTAEEDLKRLDRELVEARSVAEEKEKLSGRDKMAKLAKRIKNLLETKEELCGDTTSAENSVRGVGALVLESQIKALRSQGEEFGSKYGGWNELIKGVIEDETEDETKTDADKEEQENIPEEKTSAPAQDDGLSSEERIAKVKDLMKRMNESEEALEKASAEEDYDLAAELHEVFQEIQSELESINLTDEESALVFAEATTDASPTTGGAEETPKENEAVDAANTEDDDEKASGETSVDVPASGEDLEAEIDDDSDSPPEDNSQEGEDVPTMQTEEEPETSRAEEEIVEE